MDLVIRVSLHQRAMLQLLAARGGSAMYRFGVTEADFKERDGSTAQDPERRSQMQRNKEGSDRSIRAMALPHMSLITIEEMILPDPNGRKHRLILTDVGRKILSQMKQKS